MAAAGFVGPPSVYGISQKADEVVNGQTWTAAEPRKEAPPSTENMTKLPSDVKEAVSRETLDIMNGWVPPEFPNKETVASSATVARAVTVAQAPWESLAKKAAILGNASATKTEALPGDNRGVVYVVIFRAGVFQEHDLKPVFDDEHGKLVIELNTTDEERKLMLEKLGMEKIAKEVGVFPADVKVNVSGIRWTWREEEHGVLTVVVPIDHQEPEKKRGAVKKLLGFVKGALAKAAPACLCVAAKEFVDEMNGDTEV